MARAAHRLVLVEQGGDFVEAIEQEGTVVADAPDAFGEFEDEARPNVDRLLTLGAAGHGGTCFGCFEGPVP